MRYALTPIMPNITIWRGNVYYLKEERKQARADYETILQLNTDSSLVSLAREELEWLEK